MHAGAATLLLVVAAGSIPVAQVTQILEPSQPGDARVLLTLDRPSFFLGEQVLVHYCIENISNRPFSISMGGDSRAATRSQRFRVTVTDAKGRTMPDPDPMRFNLGGLGGEPGIAPGDRWCQSLPLMRYARIDAPGTYSIAVVHDLGWKATKPPEGRVAIDLAMPDERQAERIVNETLALPRELSTVMGQLRRPFQDLSTLHYAVYLPFLVRLVEDRDTRAFSAIGAIPSPDATRALIGLLKHSDKQRAYEASRALAMRLPDPALEGALPGRSPFGNEQEDPRRYLRDASWRPEFGADLRSVATVWLAESDVTMVIQAAVMMQAVGRPNDAPALITALDGALERSLSQPLEKGGYPRPRGAMQELMRTAEVFVARGYRASKVDTPGSAALWLAAFGRGYRPAGWQTEMQALLSHRIPYIRELALTRLPGDAPAELFEAVGRALQSTDLDLQVAAFETIRRVRLDSYKEQLIAVAKTAKDYTFLGRATNALAAISGRMEVLEVMAERLTEPELFPHAVWHLLSAVVEVSDGGTVSGPASAADREALSKRWSAFLSAHRAEIEAGKRFPLSHPAVPVLIPPGWKVTPPGKLSGGESRKPQWRLS